MSKTLDDATPLVLDELVRRAKDQPELFSDGALIKLAELLDRRAERQARLEAEQVAEEAKPFRLLDELDVLPVPRAHKLALAERERLVNEWRALDDWMEANPVA